MTEAAPPTGTDFTANAGSLKKGDTKEAAGHIVNPAAVAVFKKAFVDGGGDEAKVCKALRMEELTWADGERPAFLPKCHGVK